MFGDNQYSAGDHCGSASLQNRSRYYDWGLGEAACFGLGAGIGFEYGESETASRLIMGRNRHLESTFFDTLGISIAEGNGQSRETAWDALEKRLESGPVLCFVDLYYLSYFESSTHFGPHTIVVLHADKESVTISDSEFDEPQTVPRDAFDDAWSSDHGFWPVERRWLAVEDPTPTVPTETATLAAVRSPTSCWIERPLSSSTISTRAVQCSAGARTSITGWYSLATGIRAYLDLSGSMETLQEMYQEWPFFRTMLDNAALALARTDMDIASRYADLADDDLREEFFSRITAEYDAAVSLVTAITGRETLVGGGWLEESLERRNPYVDPLNLLQIHLPEKDSRDELEEWTLRLTVKGIAAGMKNTV